MVLTPKAKGALGMVYNCYNPVGYVCTSKSTTKSYFLADHSFICHSNHNVCKQQTLDAGILVLASDFSKLAVKLRRFVSNQHRDWKQLAEESVPSYEI